MPYRTTPKMAERKNDRRRSMLAAAMRLFGRRGYHATTIPMIVSEAGTSTGNFYFYFRNKEDIFGAVLSDLGERISSTINASVAKAGADLLMHMQAAVEGLVLFLAQNPEQARILIVESSGLSRGLEQIRRSIIASHARGVEKTIQLLAPKLPAIEPTIAGRCRVGAVYEAVYSWLELPEEKRPAVETVGRAVAHFNLRGIGTPPENL